nr:hypothetical protein [Ureaplasma sp.]
MSKKSKIIIFILFTILTLGIGLSIFTTFTMWNEVKTLKTEINLKNDNQNNESNEPSIDNDSTNKEPIISDQIDDSNESDSNLDNETNNKNPSDKVDNIEADNLTNSQPNDKFDPPEIDLNGPINSDFNSLEMQKKLSEYLNKYDFVRNTTQYQDQFLNNLGLIFNETKIRNNTYQLIRNAILKTKTYNENTMSLKITVKYQLNKNNKSIRLWIQWSTKLKDIGFNVIRN